MVNWSVVKRIAGKLLIPVLMGVATGINELISRQEAQSSKELLERVKVLTEKVEAIVPENGGVNIGEE